jgi:hypothetical protein
LTGATSGSSNGSGGTVTEWPADIEVILRRVVREEIRFGDWLEAPNPATDRKK